MSRTPVVLVSLFLMSCIIPTDPNIPDPANTPPVVEEHSETPMNRFVDIDLAAPSGPDGGAMSQERFVATVRDPDIEQALEGLVYINYDPNRPRPITFFDIPTTMSATRRVEFFVDRTIQEIVSGGCPILELHVSRSFGPNFQPDDPDDIGKGRWFLRIQPADGSEATCQRGM